MNNSKHTPGPWRVGTPGPNGCYSVGTTKGLMTAMVAHSINMADQREQAEGDARLIAAAPELLAALISLLAMCERQTDFNDDGDGAMFEHCRAAIAKATGQ